MKCPRVAPRFVISAALVPVLVCVFSIPVYSELPPKPGPDYWDNWEKEKKKQEGIDARNLDGSETASSGESSKGGAMPIGEAEDMPPVEGHGLEGVYTDELRDELIQQNYISVSEQPSGNGDIEVPPGFQLVAGYSGREMQLSLVGPSEFSRNITYTDTFAAELADTLPSEIANLERGVNELTSRISELQADLNAMWPVIMVQMSASDRAGAAMQKAWQEYEDTSLLSPFREGARQAYLNARAEWETENKRHDEAVELRNQFAQELAGAEEQKANLKQQLGDAKGLLDWAEQHLERASVSPNTGGRKTSFNAFQRYDAIRQGPSATMRGYASMTPAGSFDSRNLDPSVVHSSPNSSPDHKADCG